jgi:hypothetical protein
MAEGAGFEHQPIDAMGSEFESGDLASPGIVHAAALHFGTALFGVELLNDDSGERAAKAGSVPVLQGSTTLTGPAV